MGRKIALVTPTWEKVVGGVDIFNRDLEKIIKNRGHSLDIFSLESFPDTKKEISGNEEMLSEYFNKINKKKKYDLVICNGEYGYGLEHENAINVFHGNYYDYALSLKDFDSEEKTNWRLNQIPLQRESSKGKYVVAVSDFATKGLIKSGINVDEVIKLSVDTNNFKPSNTKNRRYNLSVSRGDYYGKGLDILENWAENLSEEIIFLGEYSGKLKNITQPGFVKHDELNKYYNECNVFFNPSRFEGAGLTTLEAMACKRPVITTSTGYGEDIMKQIPEFVVQNIEDKNEFSKKYSEIVSKIEIYSKKSLDYFWTFHNPKVFEDRWVYLIERG